MDTVLRQPGWTARQIAAIVLCVMAAALLAGGLGGYLIHGTSTSVVTRTVQLPVAADNPALAPYFGTYRSSSGHIPGL
jgi:hypothetical protein